jgi:hypothetical protein
VSRRLVAGPFTGKLTDGPRRPLNCANLLNRTR